MPFQQTVFNRMGDVMLALREAEKANVSPTRIQLQKFVYLVDVLGQIVGVLKPVHGHKTYKNGPYDSAIQNAVDALAFRGFVRIAGVWKTPSGTLGTRYALASAGESFLRRYDEHPLLGKKTAIVRMVGDHLVELGWDRIVRLVYAEPTYVAARAAGWGVSLQPQDGLSVSSALVIAIMRRVIDTLSQTKSTSPEWLADQFFAFLDDYDKNYGEKREGDPRP